MKMMSEVPAPCDCIITEVLKEDGQLVSFDEAIIRYQPC
jgi:biotin carboxyl carrier protein